MAEQEVPIINENLKSSQVPYPKKISPFGGYSYSGLNRRCHLIPNTLKFLERLTML